MYLCEPNKSISWYYVGIANPIIFKDHYFDNVSHVSVATWL